MDTPRRWRDLRRFGSFLRTLAPRMVRNQGKSATRPQAGARLHAGGVAASAARCTLGPEILRIKGKSAPSELSNLLAGDALDVAVTAGTVGDATPKTSADDIFRAWWQLDLRF